MNSLSITENRVLMAQARESLKGKWGLAVGVGFLFLLIMIVPQIFNKFNPIIGLIISILITGPLYMGIAIFALSISRKQDARISQIFKGFEKFDVGIVTFLLMWIFIILWLLLLIVPGIIAALSYSQTYFIITDDNKIRPLEAITKSKELMRGNKWKFFCLCCRFLGWFLLCILTLGIGFLWYIPYLWVSWAKFYDDLQLQQSIKEWKPLSEQEEEEKRLAAERILEKDEVTEKTRAAALQPNIEIKLAVVGGNLLSKICTAKVSDTCTIGRSSTATIKIPDDDEISGIHCEVVFKEGMLFIRDLDSTNGTYINGVRLAGVYKLENDDLIRLGRTEFRITMGKVTL